MRAPHGGRASFYCQPLTAGQAVKQIMAACTGVDRSISVKRPAAGWNNCRYSDLLPTRGWCQPLADLRLRACSGWHWAGGRNRVRTSDAWVVRYAPRVGHRRSLGLRAKCGLPETGGIGCGCGQAWWSALITMGCAPPPRCELAPGCAARIVQEGRLGCTALRQRVSSVHDHCRAPARARASWHSWHGHARGAGHQPRPGAPAIRPRIPGRDRGWPRNSQPRAATFHPRRSAIRAAGHKTGRAPNPGRSGSDHAVGTGQP